MLDLYKKWNMWKKQVLNKEIYHRWIDFFKLKPTDEQVLLLDNILKYEIKEYNRYTNYSIMFMFIFGLTVGAIATYGVMK